MAFNELEAMKLIDDGKISDEEIKLLTRIRDGITASELEGENADSKDAKAFAELDRKGLVQRTALSAPRSSLQVDVVIASEAGTTVLNLFDKRFRENANAERDSLTAPDADPELLKAPTDEQKRKVPALEAETVEADKKNIGHKPGNEEQAMKDPLVAAGARDPANAQIDADRVITDDAKVTVPKDASIKVDGEAFDHDGDGKVGGSKKK